MILNNETLTEFLLENPDAAMVRINPLLKKKESVLWRCEQAALTNNIPIIQITTNSFSDSLWLHTGEMHIISNNTDHESFVDELSSKGYIVYVPYIGDVGTITNNFDNLDLGISLAQKQKFKYCYAKLAVSYLYYIKPFKKYFLFAFGGMEELFFWLMEKQVYQTLVPNAIREPVFIPTIPRDENGLSCSEENLQTIALIKNHVKYNIGNIGNADLEIPLLHEATQRIANGENVILENFIASSDFGIQSYTGYPLPQDIRLHNIKYSGKWNNFIKLTDIIVEEL